MKFLSADNTWILITFFAKIMNMLEFMLISI